MNFIPNPEQGIARKIRMFGLIQGMCENAPWWVPALSAAAMFGVAVLLLRSVGGNCRRSTLPLSCLSRLAWWGCS